MNVFGPITRRKCILMVRFNGLQRALKKYHSDSLQELEHFLKKDLDEVLL